MEIEITSEMVDIAQAAEETIIKNLTKLKKFGSHLDRTGVYRDGQFYYGCIGELAFMEALKRVGKHAYYKPRFDGHKDRGDVTLYLPDMETAVDVKTASKPTHQFLMLPKKQAQLHHYTAYIAVKLYPHMAQIMGYAVHDDLKDVTDLILRVPTVGVPFYELRPIEGVLSKLEDGETVIDLSNLGGKYVAA